MTTKKTLKGFCTKYALTAGIYPVTCSSQHANDHNYVYTVTDGRNAYRTKLIYGKNFFLTREEAEAEAVRMAERKCRSLSLKLEQVRRLVATPRWRES